MSEKSIVLITHHADGKNQNVTAKGSHPAKVVVKPGSQYLLKNETNDFAPENVILKRVGDDLFVIQEGESEPVIILEDYYANDGHPPLLLGMAEDGMLYPYIPVSGEGYETGYLMADGQLSPVALGGDTYGPGAPYVAAQEDSNTLYPLFGLLAGAGAIGTGAAIIHHNNKDDDSSSPAVTPPHSQGIGQITDNTGPVRGALTDGAITDESMPQISGQGTAGNIVTLYDNGTAIGSATIDADGKWSWTPAAPMADGSHALHTTETDPAGNVSDASDAITIIVDTVPPDQSTVPTITDSAGNVIVNGGATNEVQPNISGKGEAGNTVVIYDNDQPIGSVVVSPDGSWSFTPDEPMEEGSHSINTIETDPAGNSSAPTEANDITIDTVAPEKAATPTITDNVGDITGPLNSGDSTDDAQPELSGKGEAGSTVIIYDNDQPIGSVVVDADGSWSWTPDAPLAEGEHSIHTTETDVAGNTSAPTDAVTITVDTTAPDQGGTPTIKDDAGNVIDNGGATNDAQPEISGKGEAGNTVVIYDNDKPIGSVVVDADGSWSYTPDAPMADGSHSINTVETDAAGNSSAPSPAEVITVDTVEPNAVVPTIKDDAGNVVNSGDTTRDAQPEISGTGEAGNTVVIYDNDKPIGSVVVDADGSWSYTPDVPMADGSHSINTTETDAAGNTSAPTTAEVITIDTVAPEKAAAPVATDNVGDVTGPILNGGLTDDGQPGFSGKGEAGNTVVIYDNDQAIGSATIDADGNWSWKPATPMAEGNHSIHTTETDKAGNTSVPSDTLGFTTDTTPPDVTKLAITGYADDVGEVTGNVISGGSSDDTTPVISGTGTAGDTITVYDTLNGTQIVLGSATVGADGTWQLAVDGAHALAAGTHGLTAVESDPAGNSTSPTPAYTVTVVTGAPAAPSINTVIDDVGVTEPLQKGAVTNDSTPTLNGTAGNSVTVRIYDNGTLIGSTTSGADGTWSFTPSRGVADGSHAFTADVVNGVGQVSPQSGEWALTVDTAAPAAVSDLVVTDDAGALTGALADGDTTDDSTPTLSGTAEAGGTVNIIDNGQVIGSVTAGKDGAWSWTPAAALADGDHTLAVSVTDAAGNTGAATPGLTVTVDTSGNLIQITSVTDSAGSVTGNIAAGGVTDDAAPVVNGTGKAGSVVSLYDGDVLVGTATVRGNGIWSLAPGAALAEGPHTLRAVSTDAAGVVSDAVTFSFTVDLTAPARPVIGGATDDVGSVQGALANGAVSDDPTPTLTGTAEAGSTVTIYDGGTVLGSVTAGADGAWSFTPTSTLGEGAHSFTATATDAAGNTGPASAGFELTLDFTPPDAANLAITGYEDDAGEVTGNVVSGSSSDDTTPVISGTGTAGNTITVYDTLNGTQTVLGSATVGADGTWRLAVDDANALALGTHGLTAVESDPAGNSTSPTPAYTVTVVSATLPTPTIDTVMDDAGVYVGALTTGATTDDTTPTLAGTATANSTVRLYDNGTLIASVTASAQGTWTYTVSPALPDGAHAFTVDAVNSVGQHSKQSTAFDMTLDTSGPNVTGMTTTAAISTDTSSGLVVGDLFSHSTDATNSDMITRDSTVTISGKLSQALKSTEILQITFDNGKTWASLLSDSGTDWNYTLAAATASTTYDYHLRVINSVGVIAADTAFKDKYQVVIDLDSPDALTRAPKVDAAISSNDVLLFSSTTYGRVEAGAIVSLVSDVNQNGTYQEGLDKVLGFATANSDGTWSMSVSLPTGAHNLAFVVWDLAGNRSAMSVSTSTGVTDGSGVTVIEQNWGGTTDADNRGLNAAAVTINQYGGWSFAQSVRGTTGTTTANALRVYNEVNQQDYTSTYLDQPSKANGAEYNVNDTSYSRYINSMTFADINRDGYTDIMSQVSSYGNANHTAYWMQNADGTYQAHALNQGSLNHLGGVIAYDREGDGYLDFVLADSESDSISFIKNVNGSLTYESNKGFSNGHPGGAIPSALSILHEVGAVDIDNNGTVDITAHIDYNGASSYVGNASRGLGILYNTANGNGTTSFSSVGYYANVFRNDGANDYGNYSMSMTYADFNGDGWLDLFLSGGSKAGVNSNENRIYLNDGKGNLLASDANALWFGDSLLGGTSLAVDWNHDGKMDIIEIPRSGTSGSPTLYLNTGTNNWRTAGITLTDSDYSNLTGAVALDYDWDGSMDLVVYRSGADAAVVSSDNSAPTLLVKNTNVAADGTSLKIRIVDGEGINTFYSNTVKLYNSAGELVATQLINPQASGSSNSMGLVSFFGLDVNETYSVQLLRVTNGAANHVGATASIGGYINGTVNENWGNLTTGKSHDAYVLTAEKISDVNSTTGNGIIGTGYNDTFFSTAGNDTYTGGGGWNLTVTGTQVWSETAGLDIVDYSHAPGAITANLKTGVAVGHGFDTLVSIEGLIGTSEGDTFTDNAANNQFEGRGGNDVFWLTNGGNDVLMYKVLTGYKSDGTGGNGHDTVHDFHVGNLATDSNADLIDLSDLLDYTGSISFFRDNGVLQLDNSSRDILNYLKVETSGHNTVISIDRDGTGGAYGFTNIITLADTQTDLVTLLQNNQIMV
ncbi:Ig-like domain-containing protein [Pantoea sp. GD03673]|uniref:Ig-like domain-containing protein n=1 Tax=Pantoea sp. GD03673 TaxID=2975364 RepID=UPI00244B137B|nr:Ig-like domain-containing protein [Pantoea sp. GD03673]MDH2067734.1 Ig-like domain-containing protein [Pantoea sp. GD03673]